MISLVQNLVPLFLGEGLQLQRLVGEERHGQVEVFVPELRVEQAVQILTPSLPSRSSS